MGYWRPKPDPEEQTPVCNCYRELTRTSDLAPLLHSPSPLALCPRRTPFIFFLRGANRIQDIPVGQTAYDEPR